MKILSITALFLLGALSLPAQQKAAGGGKTILLIAGSPSHGPGQHEHNAGVRLIEKWLKTVKGVQPVASLNGEWPADALIEKADAIFFFFDGTGSHMVFKTPERVAAINKAAERGAGLMFYHYATEPPLDKGHTEMQQWIGGHFKVDLSVNPHWMANFTELPKHPITRGVKPFSVNDEWYYNMSFIDPPKGLTPILSAIPPKETVSEKDGPRSGNPDVRSKLGKPAVVVWAYERANKGRGVGFTGGHHHRNFGDENFRKVTLNALLWAAKMDVPRDGVQVSVTDAEMTENLDPKPQRRPRPEGQSGAPTSGTPQAAPVKP